MSTANDETFEPVVIVTQKPISTLSVTPSKPTTETNFEDPGLEMSLAHITGQLAAMPETSMIQNDAKDSNMMTTSQELMSYEKIETITPKVTTVSFATTVEEGDNDEMVQIVHSLDSSSEEHSPEKDTMAVEESRAHTMRHEYEGLALPSKNKNNEFGLDDLDFLDLSEIGESVGDQLGIFGRNKRQNKHNKDTKVHGFKNENNDYDVLDISGFSKSVGKELGLFGRNKRQNRNKEVKVQGNKGNKDYDDMLGLDALGESFGLDRSDTNKNKRNRRRQNKMMRGEWSQV